MTNPIADVAGRVEPGVRMIGAEMRVWSDADSSRTPVGSAAIHILLTALPAHGRVLVAGPHDPDLIDAISGLGLDVDVLLRSLPDARSARVRHAGSDTADGRIQILCGTIDRLDGAAPGYHAVIALDGVQRLLSPDSRALSWTETVTALRDATRSDGTIVLLVENRFDLTRLSRVDEPDTDFRPTGVLGSASPPSGYAASMRALDRVGLREETTFAVYPSREHPDLYVSRDATMHRDAAVNRDPAVNRDVDDSVVATIIAAAYAAERDVSDGRVLAEPGRLARDAATHGLGFDLAPAWIVLASRDPAQRSNRAPGTSAPAIVRTDAGAGFWSVPHVVDRGDDGVWWRRPADRAASTKMLGYLSRDPAALAGPVPHGELLEEILLAACARHDHTGMRRVMRDYAAWLHADSDGDAADPAKVSGTFDNVLMTGLGRWEMLDPSWSVQRAVSVPVAMIRAARRFAARLLASGSPHPWPSDASLDRIALTLVAMTGMTVAPADLADATLLAATVETRRTEPGEDRVAVLTAWFSRDDPAHGLGHAETARLAARRATELADARAQIAWLDQTLAERDEQLSLAGRKLSEIRSSITYRLGHLCTYPAIKAMALVRRGTRH